MKLPTPNTPENVQLVLNAFSIAKSDLELAAMAKQVGDACLAELYVFFHHRIVNT